MSNRRGLALFVDDIRAAGIAYRAIAGPSSVVQRWQRTCIKRRTMELIHGGIFLVVVSLFGLVVYKVYRFAMRGKTYEEAIAEQRNMPLEHLLLGKGKDKNKEKKTKKVGKKAKEKPIEKEKSEVQTKGPSTASVKGDGVQKTAAVAGSKVESVPKSSANTAAKPASSSSTTIHSEKHRAVEFEPDAEVVSDQGVSQDEGKSKKKKKADKGVKPILLNRDEVSPVDASLVKDEPDTPRTVNHFEESKPKDEFLKRKHSKEEAGSLTVHKAKEKSKPASVPEKIQSHSDQAHSEPSDAKAKTGEKEQKVEEKVSRSYASAPTAAVAPTPQPEKATSVQEAVREEIEAQAVLPVQTAPAPASSNSQETKRKKKKNDLLTLQQMAGSGGVNISLLEPLIRKADLSRSEVQNLIDLLLNKQQESTTEDSEWTEGRQDPVVKLKKQLAEREKSLAEEQEAAQQWQVKVRELRSELNGERTRHGSAVRKLEADLERLNAKIQNATDSHTEEKRVLVAQVQELQNKLSEERVQHLKFQEQEKQTVATLRQELHGQHSQLDAHMAHLREQHQAEKEKILADIARLQEEVKSREESRVMLTTELRQAQEQLSALQASCSGSEEECKRLREVASNAEAAAKIAVGDANSAREMAHRIKEDAQKSCIELEQQLAELKAVTSSLKMRETELESQLSRVISEAEAEKGRFQSSLAESEERARRAEEALVLAEAGNNAAGGKAEAELQSQQRLLQEKEAFIQQLSEELSYYKTEIPRLSEALEVQKKKNDELRQKNWKAMEALTATENSLKAHLKNSQSVAIEDSQRVIKEEQSAVRCLLQRLFPEVNVEETLSHAEWVKKFETCANECLRTSINTDRPSECEDHLKKIQSLELTAAHYVKVIEKTESMLSDLQKRVEEQEHCWFNQLDKKDQQMKLLYTKYKELADRCHGNINFEDASFLSTELNWLQELNDDPSKEVVKVNSLVKVSQTSLNQEQCQTKEVEDELEKLKVQPQNHTATNGPANESSISESFSKEVKSSSNAVSSTDLPNLEKRGKSRKKKGGSAKN
ncbi:ribosome-binding protein 1 isoform X3 [Ischnura elegans]|uniref:ribosome-binding protein 1 isoform X3 n=1 Tax=Ischnura elegans TaxID=197161 RepID=UPI001ED8BC47|nr:ribosome-binding protein 1 isoform X3 [Ischnura elegans]